MEMTKNDFIEKVFDYEKENDWKFKGDKPCLIDCHALWCRPCLAMTPILEELSDEYKGKVDIYKVDVDEENEIAALFNVQSIPTFIFIPKNSEPIVTQGALPKSALRKIIEEHLL